MKNTITLVLVLAALAFGGKWAWERFGSEVAADDALRRVRAVLDGMRDGGDEQAAASMFLEGVTTIQDEARLSLAWDRWMDWRRERGLALSISSYEVGDADLGGAVPVVSVRIEGMAHRIAVPPGERLRWVE